MYDNDSICMEEVYISNLFSSVAELEERNLKKKNITLSYSCHKEKRLLDKDLMISLLTNLVDNAIKASDTDSDIFMEADGNRVTVRDEGCGLGLALGGKIAELHGAKLEITSRVGAGTAVSVVFHDMET